MKESKEMGQGTFVFRFTDTDIFVVQVSEPPEGNFRWIVIPHPGRYILRGNNEKDIAVVKLE